MNQRDATGNPVQRLRVAERADLQPAGGGRGGRLLRGRRGAALVDPDVHPRRSAVVSLPLVDRLRRRHRRVPVHGGTDALDPGALGIQYRLGVDGISVLLILLTTGWIMPLCVLASWNYIKVRVKEFMICLLVMETAMIGVFCALDFVLFFVFWEAMLIPMALLIGIWGGPRRGLRGAEVLHLHDGGIGAAAGRDHRPCG